MNNAVFIPIEKINRKIFFIRNKKVMIDADLAELYGVKTKELNKAVARNAKRFPADFAFQLTKDEKESLRFQFGTSNDENERLRSQIVTSKQKRGGRRYLPYAFTEQGIAMLSSVLKSDRAVLVNIEIMRSFVRLRELLSTHTELARQIESLETKYDAQFKVVFEAIRKIMEPQVFLEAEEKKERIGYKVTEDTSKRS